MDNCYLSLSLSLHRPLALRPITGISLPGFSLYNDLHHVPTQQLQMEVSWNGGTPKSLVSVGFSIINHPFRGTPIYGTPQIAKNHHPSNAAPHRFHQHVSWLSPLKIAALVARRRLMAWTVVQGLVEGNIYRKPSVFTIEYWRFPVNAPLKTNPMIVAAFVFQHICRLMCSNWLTSLFSVAVKR